jgi:hypothetical protein
MAYQFVALVPSGNGADFLLKVERRPSWLEGLFGAEAGPEAFYGPRPAWVRMEGRAATRSEQRALDALWKQHGGGLKVAADPWKDVEATGDEQNSQMPGRATGVATKFAPARP